MVLYHDASQDHAEFVDLTSELISNHVDAEVESLRSLDVAFVPRHPLHNQLGMLVLPNSPREDTLCSTSIELKKCTDHVILLIYIFASTSWQIWLIGWPSVSQNLRQFFSRRGV